ncbi:ATP-binding cassette domain-containing protein [Sporolactobacillus shoreicorticis]|uniref:Metal ABC transporter ATP-binding protein n=1 Tax=Sporolactobacillus shoreicorticis TaxID=1923877 RepID=A0ABW5S0D9_9BACL|nr:ATP-binding cassette domain-containing protein [Sporolactobacillus shoreicorticis]MCO7127625.1 ATP-binding cassette domain-containing protein [Sporolactobacillus shoreicorticis]
MLRRVQINNLHVSFNGEEILKELSFDVSPAQMYAIIGPNGAGKSTLLKSILGLIHPQDGEIVLSSDQKKTVIGYVPQSRVIDDEMPISARDFISLGQTASPFPWLSRREKKTLKEIMLFTDSDRLARKPVGKLSGGERQRVFLAQALVRHPDLLLLDESTANLDPDAQRRMMELVKKSVNEWGVTVLFICHDLQMVRTYADHILLMSRNFFKTGDVPSILDDQNLLKSVFQSSFVEGERRHESPASSGLSLSASSK